MPACVHPPTLGDAMHTTQHPPQRAAAPGWKTGPNGVLQEAFFTLWPWRLTCGSHRGTGNGWENFPTRGRFSGDGSVFSVKSGHESAAPEVAESLRASRLPWVMKFYLNKAASQMGKGERPSTPAPETLEEASACARVRPRPGCLRLECAAHRWRATEEVLGFLPKMGEPAD